MKIFSNRFLVNNQNSSAILTIPNLISLLRILLLLPLAICIWQNNLSATIILMVIAIASDFLDGILARRLNQISELGKILDPLADKLATVIILTILYLKHQVPLWLVIIIVGRDVAIVVAGLFMAKKYRLVTPSNFIGKVTVNVIALMVVSFIFDIEILQRVFVPLSIFFVLWSSYSYLKRFFEVQKNINF